MALRPKRPGKLDWGGLAWMGAAVMVRVVQLLLITSFCLQVPVDARIVQARARRIGLGQDR